MYEPFSDLALHAGYNVALVLTALLAVNVTQRINVAINENQFNMDLLRFAHISGCLNQPQIKIHMSTSWMLTSLISLL